MRWRDTARICGVALAAVAVSVPALSRPASAQGIERTLAGIRLGTRAQNVLAKYGNPDEVIVGDVGVRLPAQTGGGAGGAAGARGGGFGAPGGGFGGGLPAMGGPGGAPGGFGGVGGPTDDVVGAPGGAPPPGAFGPPPGVGGGPGGGMPGAPGGMGMMRGGGGSPGGYGGYAGPGGPGGSGFAGGFGGGPPGGFGGPGGGFGAGDGVGGGGAVGTFGQTTSTLARQQEVTWIYNRRVSNNIVSYEFLIGPSGNVIQIRALGYSGGSARTQRGVRLGSAYKDVVRLYGYPEEHAKVGPVLVASYRRRAHASFQFLNEKVFSITIATVE